MLFHQIVGKEYTSIKHSFDTWHGAKNLGKKILEVSFFFRANSVLYTSANAFVGVTLIFCTIPPKGCIYVPFVVYDLVLLSHLYLPIFLY